MAPAQQWISSSKVIHVPSGYPDPYLRVCSCLSCGTSPQPDQLLKCPAVTALESMLVVTTGRAKKSRTEGDQATATTDEDDKQLKDSEAVADEDPDDAEAAKFKFLRKTWQNGVAPEFLMQLLAVVPAHVEAIILPFPLPFATGIMKGVLEWNRVYGKLRAYELQLMMKVAPKGITAEGGVSNMDIRHNFALAVEVVKTDMSTVADATVVSRGTQSQKRPRQSPRKLKLERDGNEEGGPDKNPVHEDDAGDEDGEELDLAGELSMTEHGYQGCITVGAALCSKELASVAQADSDEESPEQNVMSKERMVISRRNFLAMSKHKVQVAPTSATSAPTVVGVGLHAQKQLKKDTLIACKGPLALTMSSWFLVFAASVWFLPVISSKLRPWFDSLHDARAFATEVDCQQRICRVRIQDESEMVEMDDEDEENPRQGGKCKFIVLTGIAGFVNHFDGLGLVPNAQLVLNPSAGLGSHLLQLKILKQIPRNTEILIDYGTEMQLPRLPPLPPPAPKVKRKARAKKPPTPRKNAAKTEGGDEAKPELEKKEKTEEKSEEEEPEPDEEEENEKDMNDDEANGRDMEE
ncbi:unnamed protein product [Symbiodinium sp. CCMP2592]|nr:unnamed protein product [Symbiodinium sp. CCMP2592]